MQNVKQQFNIKNFHFLVVLFSFLFLVFYFNSAHAATLYFSPSTGNFDVGNILTANVYVNTQGVAINNTEVTINFPTDMLDVVSVSKSGSIFSLWVEEPGFSNSAGTISFSGGLPTPGFNGSAGKLISVVFRVKDAGTASLLFPSAAVRANDGFGTDVLQVASQAQFNLISAERPVQPIPTAVGVPSAPNISSPTHPNSDLWYSKGVATFNWSVGNDITASKLLVGSLPDADPVVLYRPPNKQKTIDDLGDGIWYFHVALENDSGWGQTRHFRFKIDTNKPDRFDISLVDRQDATDPRVKLIFDAHDDTSGIDYFEIQIDGKPSYTKQDTADNIIEIPELNAGKHIVSAKAFDKAGNFLQSSVEFEVAGLAPPVFTEYPEELPANENLVLRGTTYANSAVTIYLQKDSKKPEEHAIRSDADGEFVFIAEDTFLSDTYKAWATVSDERGAISASSDIVTFVVKRPEFLRIGTLALDVMSVFVPLLTLLLFAFFAIWYTWHKFTGLKKEVRKDVRSIDARLHKVFDLLKEDILDEIKLVEHAKTKRDLTKEEQRIIKRLREDLEDAEKFIKEEIKELEKDVE